MDHLKGASLGQAWLKVELTRVELLTGHKSANWLLALPQILD